jgi:CelD/BcsL family acetyltransferase involved in cellulose biosynthesis
VRLELLSEIPNDSVLRAAWNALVRTTDQPQVFYTWEWARAVDVAYHSTLRPMLFLARHGEALSGLVTLAIDDQKRAVFLNSSTGDYCDFISAPAQRGEFVDAVISELQKAGIRDLSLTNLPADSPTIPALKTATVRLGLHIYARPAYECARVVLGSAEERAQLKLKLGKKKTFRRSMHALAREGPVKVSHLTTWDQVEPLLPAFANAHIARFLATGRLSNLARSARRTFLHELARLLCESGSLALSRFITGDDVIAWHYGFRFRGTWFWYQPTFESSLEVHSPGRLLLANMLIEACDNPEVEIFDLGLGAEGYKERVANATRPTLQVTVSPSPAAIARERMRFRSAELVKRSPRLESAVRATLAYAEAARQNLSTRGPARFASQIASRTLQSAAGRDEVRFYQWPEQNPKNDPHNDLALESIDLHRLASALVAYEDDSETATYLLRSAQRFMAGTDSGFILADSSATPLHFCWAAQFEGFSIAELHTRLSAPSPDATMIFDCWTPPALRGRGLYSAAITRLAQRLASVGRKPWIFSAAANTSSLRAIDHAGFQYRYSMISRKTPFGRKITTKPAPDIGYP